MLINANHMYGKLPNKMSIMIIKGLKLDIEFFRPQ